MSQNWFGPVLDELACNVTFDTAQRQRALHLLTLISQYAGGSVNEIGAVARRQSLAALDRYIGDLRLPRPHAKASDILNGLQAVVDRMKGEVLAPHILPGVRSKKALDWRHRTESTRLALLSLSSVPDEITMLTDGNYHPYLLKAFTDAQWQIVVAMGQIAVTSFHGHPTRTLIDELGRAIVRGVDVDVFTSEPAQPGTVAKPQRLALDALERAGARVHAARISSLFHYKAIVIDKLVSIIGSHNWTLPALTQNRELSIAIRSREMAAQTLASIGRGFTR
jgi:phosphatidylserine/phosphatidylglycerophosphate/cardiolipin synthase-like enzyme